MRIGMVHQPHFLPWPGYLARCLAVDVFIALDTVKFNRNHYQHRTKFIGRDTRLHWISLPIAGATRSGSILDVRMADGFEIRKWERSIVESYRDAPLFHELWAKVTDLIVSNHPSFCDVSITLLKWILSELCKSLSRADTEVICASELYISDDRTLRLIDICTHERITHLVMGAHALRVHDIDLLKRSGIRLLGHKFIGPDNELPAPGLMGLHYMIRNGIDRAARDLVSHWALSD